MVKVLFQVFFLLLHLSSCWVHQELKNPLILHNLSEHPCILWTCSLMIFKHIKLLPLTCEYCRIGWLRILLVADHDELFQSRRLLTYCLCFDNFLCIIPCHQHCGRVKKFHLFHWSWNLLVMTWPYYFLPSRVWI